MLSSTILTASLLVASVVATPWGPGGPFGGWPGKGGPGGPQQNCLDDAEVQKILSDYTYLLQYPQGANFNATAGAALSDKFFVSSDSINSLAGIPVSAR